MNLMNAEWFASGEYLLVLVTVSQAVIFMAVLFGFIAWVKSRKK